MQERLDPPRRRTRGTGVALWLAQFVAYAFAWWVFTGSTSRSELALGLACAAMAATASQVVWGEHLVHLAARPRWVAQGLKLPWLVLRGTASIFALLARRVLGRRPWRSVVRAMPYAAVGDDAECEALRALAVAYTTVSPDSVVVGIDTKRGEFVYHLLDERAESPTLPRALGAGEQ